MENWAALMGLDEGNGDTGYKKHLQLSAGISCKDKIFFCLLFCLKYITCDIPALKCVKTAFVNDKSVILLLLWES